MSAQALAEESKVSLRTIRRAEKDNGIVGITEANAARVIETLEKRGVVFDFNGSAGVSLRKRPPPKFGD